MKPTSYILYTFFSLLIFSCSTDAPNDIIEQIDPDITINPDAEIEELYFPLVSSTSWESASLEQLNWQEDKTEELYDYLEEKNSKGFIVLYNGRIIIEEYFNGHSQNDLWLWNSASKSFTGSIVGIAQGEGLLDIDDKTSDYLGDSWSSLTTEQQDLITVKNHLSMNTGLDDNIDQFAAWTCTRPNCLEYMTDAGDRWAYHQGAYSLLFDIVEEAVSMDFEAYGKTKIEDKIGMNGSWVQGTFLNRYQSDARSMARFGLLMMNKGVWNDETLLSIDYFDEMINTSQSINPSYGYLWWLNGKDSYIGTSSQEVFTGNLIPNAPSDMYSALGADDQKIYVVPSENLVIIRIGDSANETQLGPSSFDNELWGMINEVIDN